MTLPSTDPCRRRPSVVIVGVGVDVNLTLGNFPQDLCAFFHLATSIHNDLIPYSRSVFDPFPVASYRALSGISHNRVEFLELLRRQPFGMEGAGPTGCGEGGCVEANEG
jgi:hypothetical protein